MLQVLFSCLPPHYWRSRESLRAALKMSRERQGCDRDAVVRSLYAAIFACYNMASGCPCLVMRATPFCFFGDRRPQLAPAVTLRFGALTPCYGHGLDHRRRQSHHCSGKRNKLNSQFHGQITSFRKRRRYQHTGLIPLTLQHCTTYIRTNVLKYRKKCSNHSERRAA